MYGDYSELSRVLLRLQVLRFSEIRSEPLEFWVICCEPFSMEEEYLYPADLYSWVRISRSPITTQLARYDLFVTAQIAPLDCRITMQRYPPLFITARIDIRALQCLEREDDLVA